MQDNTLNQVNINWIDQAKKFVDTLVNEGTPKKGIEARLNQAEFTKNEIKAALDYVDTLNINWNKVVEKRVDYQLHDTISRKQIENDLIYNDFSETEIKHGLAYLDSLKIDWNKQALNYANDMLEYGTSKANLKENLEYVEFETKEIEYALKSIEVDWNKQALLVLESRAYGYSEQGLKDLLLKDFKFTVTESNYALKEFKADYQKEAIVRAEFLVDEGVGKTGIYDILVSTYKFTKNQAQQASDNVIKKLNPDWNELALRYVNNKFMSWLNHFPTTHVEKELSWRGFTKSEIAYAIKTSGYNVKDKTLPTSTDKIFTTIMVNEVRTITHEFNVSEKYTGHNLYFSSPYKLSYLGSEGGDIAPNTFTESITVQGKEVGISTISLVDENNKVIKQLRIEVIEEKTTLPNTGFTDVPATNSFAKYVNDLVEDEIIKGYPDGSFKPNNNVTRAQVAKMIVLSAGIDPTGYTSNFKDVKNNPKEDGTASSYDYISAAVAHGIIKGYKDNTFRPNENATRAQIAVMIQRAFDLKQKGKVTKIKDVEKMGSEGQKEAVYVIVSHGIAKGYPEGFKPYNNATRGQFSKMVSEARFPGKYE